MSFHQTLELSKCETVTMPMPRGAYIDSFTFLSSSHDIGVSLLRMMILMHSKTHGYCVSDFFGFEDHTTTMTFVETASESGQHCVSDFANGEGRSGGKGLRLSDASRPLGFAAGG